MSHPELPSLECSRALAARLAGPRGRLLRRARIGHRRRVLEVGCGHGLVTAELKRRCAGLAMGLDLDIGAAKTRGSPAPLLAANAEQLPLRDGALDLVFLQNTLLWVRQVAAAVREAARVLEPGGCLVALEPDFGGMLEHPPEVGLQDVWVRALTAAGADPFIGRKLPSLCEKVGLAVWFELQGVPSPADATDLDLLAPLPLTLEERSRLAAVQGRIASRAGRWDVLVHLPYTLLVATKPLA